MKFGKMFSQSESLALEAIQGPLIEFRNARHRLGDTTNIKLYLLKSLKHKIIRERKSRFYRLTMLEEYYSFTATFSHEQVLIEQQLGYCES